MSWERLKLLTILASSWRGSSSFGPGKVVPVQEMETAVLVKPWGRQCASTHGRTGANFVHIIGYLTNGISNRYKALTCGGLIEVMVTWKGVMVGVDHGYLWGGGCARSIFPLQKLSRSFDGRYILAQRNAHTQRISERKHYLHL